MINPRRIRRIGITLLRVILVSLIFIHSAPSTFAATQTMQMPMNQMPMQMYMSASLQIIKDGLPLSHVLVTLHDQQVVTNTQGFAQFDNVTVGSQVIQTFYQHDALQQTIMINGPNTVVDYSHGTPFSSGGQVTKLSVFQLPLSPLKGFLITFAFLTVFVIVFVFLKKRPHSYTSASKKPRLLALVALLLVIAVIPLTISLVQQQSRVASFAATNTALPVPTNVQVIPEDTSVLINWNNQTGRTSFWNPQDELDQGWGGFVVYWGVCADTNCTSLVNPARKITEHPNAQLQPLASGTLYGAYVETVGYDGSVSSPTTTVTFQTDSTRVNALTSQMTGFFDDFNQPAGQFDELKWNSAFSGCVGVGAGGQFINTQFHSHNQVYDGFCDRGQGVSRPRGIFDFTGKTAANPGTIVFDMDGTQQRDFWYLDLFPATDGPIDVPGHALLDSPGVFTPPIQTLRFAQAGRGLTIYYFDATGQEFASTSTGKGCADGPNGDSHYCSPPSNVVKNYRRHWKITIYQDSPTTVHTQVFVDGALAAESANVPFPTSKVTMDWVLFAYNNEKENFPTTLLHWDNFGFDGPPQTIETHNYTDGIQGTSIPGTGGCPQGFPLVNSSSPLTQTIKIPDSIQGAVAARLMFTVQMPGCSSYATSSTDTITINGKAYPYQDVSKLAWNAGMIPGGITPEQATINIPISDLNNFKTGGGTNGDNTIVFHLSNIGVINTHMEFDFPKGQAPSYTQPGQIWPLFATPPNPSTDIGPGAVIDSINGHGADCCTWSGEAIVWPSGGKFYDPTVSGTGVISNPAGPLSGTVPLWISIGGEQALNGTGTNPGISEYDMLIDRQRVFAKATDASVPAPHVRDVYQWDTTNFCNGVHEIFVEAFNPNGTPSLANYFQAGILENGQYDPWFVITNNSNQSACSSLGTLPATLIVSPQFPVGPTNTPSPTPSGPTQTPTATLIPTTTPTPLPCPTGWSCNDIGNPAPMPIGSTTQSGSIYTVNGGGADIWNTSDQFHFFNKQISTDGSFIARILSQTATDPKAKAGIMFRQTLDPASPYFMIEQTPQGGVITQWRDIPGNISQAPATPRPVLSNPVWMRVDKSGDTYTGFSSPDGVNWTQTSQATLSMGSNLLAGLAVTSHVSGTLGTATFDTVSFTNTPSLTPTVTPLLPSSTPTPTFIPSPTTTPVPPTPSPSTTARIPGDLNPTPDGKVCIDDLSIMAKDWGRGANATPPTTLFNPLSDINGDGIVNITDLSIMAKNWGC